MNFAYGFIVGIIASIIGLILLYNNNREKIINILDWITNKF